MHSSRDKESQMASSFLTTLFPYTKHTNPSISDLMREILICIFFHAINYNTHSFLTNLYCDIIVRCSRIKPLSTEKSPAESGGYGKVSSFCVYFIACALNAFLIHLYTSDESSPYPAVFMPAPFVNLNNFFTAVVALGVMLLLRRLGFSTGSGGDEDKDGDSAEVETERSGDEKGMGEEMVGEKTGL